MTHRASKYYLQGLLELAGNWPKLVPIVLLTQSIITPLQALELRTAAQPSAPKYFIDANGESAGVCVDIMQAIEKADPELNFDGYHNYVPFKRLQRQLELGKIDVFFGFKPTAKRLALFTFSDRPLYQVNYVIAMRKDDPAVVTSLDDLRQLGSEGVIASIKGSAASRFLENHGGLAIKEHATSPDRLIKLLQAGRIRFAFYHDLGLNHVIESNRLDAEIKIPEVYFSTYNHRVAFHKSTPSSTVARLDTALDKIRASGELGRILDRYKLKRD